jgi:hypothetical protein
MTYRASLLTVPALTLALAGCGQQAGEQPTAPEQSATTTDADDTPTPVPMQSPVQPPATDAANDGYPDLTPAELVPEAEKGEKGARNVLLSFARAIELKEFDQAYAMLGDAAQQNMTRAQFNALFDGFGKITVAVPGGRSEGAAGSIYYEVPTTITGASGKKLAGTTVLRRVNDVPGASAEQLRWHIERFDVK